MYTDQSSDSASVTTIFISCSTTFRTAKCIIEKGNTNDLHCLSSIGCIIIYVSISLNGNRVPLMSTLTAVEDSFASAMATGRWFILAPSLPVLSCYGNKMTFDAGKGDKGHLVVLYPMQTFW